jgi:hypothetical protein
MDDVLRCLAHASPEALGRWEQARTPGQHVAKVKSWLKRLQQGKRPTPIQLQAEPLAMLSALDELVALSRAPRFTNSPLVAQGRAWWLVPVSAAWRGQARMRRQVGQLRHHLRHHEVIPVEVGVTTAPIQTRCVVPSGELAAALGELRQGSAKELRAWIAHFDDRCAVQWHAPRAAGRVVAVGIEPAEQRDTSWQHNLQAAIDGEAFAWLAPELGLTGEQQQELIDALLVSSAEIKPRLVAPGSWHRMCEGGHANLATLHNGFTGEPLFTHRKLRCFGNYGAEGQPDHAEGVLPGHEVFLLVTPIGNWTLLICKDFIDADASVSGLLQQLGADWVLVPSYGDDNTQVLQHRRAESLCRIEVGCHALVATLRNRKANDTSSSHLPGFWHPAGAKTANGVGEQGGMVLVPLTLAEQPDHDAVNDATPS